MTRILIVAVGLAIGLPALAQPKPQPKTEEPVLKGPTVKEDGVPGEQRQFTPGRTRGKEMMGGEIPHRLFMRVIEGLKDSEEMEVRLTPEQQSKIRQINETFTSSVGKYREDHRDEVRELLTQLTPEDRRRAMEFLARNGENRRPEIDKRKNVPKKDAGEGSMEEKADPKKAEEARERIKELLAGAPNPSDTHSKIHALLTEAQKKAFKDQLQKLRDDMEAQRGPDQRKKDGAPEPKPESKPESKRDAQPEADRDVPSLNDPRIPERARERIRNLPEDQRRDAIRRYLERREQEKKRKE